MTNEDRQREREAWLQEILSSRVIVEHSQYKVSDFVGWQRDLSLELRPHYQRGSVWGAKDRAFLIDSVIRGYPLPLIVLEEEEHQEPPYARRRVVDGQQRLRTLIAFVEPELLDPPDPLDEFEYSPPELDRRMTFGFQDLPSTVQKRILRTQLPTVLLTADPNDSSVLEVYDRLNSTGLGLSAQELRYARRDGEFADLSYRLARANQNRWLEWKVFRAVDIARMKEVEFTSEIILLMLNGVEKTGRRELDAAYKSEDWKVAVPGSHQIGGDLQAMMDLIDLELSGPPRKDPLRLFRTKGWLYSLFAFVLHSAGRLDDDYRPVERKELSGEIGSTADEVVKTMRLAGPALAKARSSDPELVRAISGSASDRASRVARLNFLREL